MNITIGESNLETIKRIQELAKKHNGRFLFGFRSGGDAEIPHDILEWLKSEEILVKDEWDDYEYNVLGYQYSSIWLEYHDDVKTMHYMSFTQEEYGLEGPSVQTTSQEDNWYADSKTTINSSFNLKDDDVHLGYPYRPGVVIGSFANHVAKLLGEPDYMKGIVY